MRRYVDLKDISDGKLYGLTDMVKADCHGCKGCHACCTGMGDSIVLNPLDMWRLTRALGCPFQQLLALGKIELHIVDGCILPNLAMTGTEEHCSFLDADGRCSVHSARPDICRLFPLGRVYEGEDFHYFLQSGECPYPSKTKVKVSKWIDTPLYESNRQFLLQWHKLLKQVEAKQPGLSEEERKTLCMTLLGTFYNWNCSDEQAFYEQFRAAATEFCSQFELI